MPLPRLATVLAAALTLAACTVNTGSPAPPPDQPRVIPASAVIVR